MDALFFKNVLENYQHQSLCVVSSDRETISEAIKTAAHDVFSSVLCEYHSYDTLRIDDVRDIRATEHYHQEGTEAHIFILAYSSAPLEAQNALLKTLEEPSPNVWFFLIVPVRQVLIETLASRVFFLYDESSSQKMFDAEAFVAMSYADRMKMIEKIFDDTDDIRSGLMVRSFFESLSKFLSLRIDDPRFSGSLEQLLGLEVFSEQEGMPVKYLCECAALALPMVSKK